MPYKNRKDQRAAEQRYRDRHRDKVRAANASWQACHPAKAKARMTRWLAQNVGARRAWKLKSKYGLTTAAFAAMLEGQGGACAICRSDLEGAANPCVDHDHQTGVVRGILCRACNLGIGLLKDDVDLLLAAVAYLKRSCK